MMSFDLSQKIFNRGGQEVVYAKDGVNIQHDILSAIAEALWEAGGNDLKTTVRMGVVADRLERSKCREAVDLTDDDILLIRQALNTVKYPAYLIVPMLGAIPKLGD